MIRRLAPLCPLWAVFLITLACAAPLAAQPVRQIDLALGQEVPDLGAALVFGLDAGGLSDAVQRIEAGGFTSPLRAVARQGAPYQPVWGAVRLHNAAPDDGRAGDPWVLTSGTFGLVGLEVRLIRDSGAVEDLLIWSARAPFRAEVFGGTRLSAAPLILAPGEGALLVVRQVFGPVQAAQFALEQPDRYQQRTFANVMALAGFYAFTAACLL